ncbi:MAG: hypothetical protein RL701_4419 [Pseudomonadota bacterium]
MIAIGGLHALTPLTEAQSPPEPAADRTEQPAAPEKLDASANEAPDAPDTREARRAFQAGVEHFEAGRYVEALGNFEHAYRLKPHPLVQVNIANCYDKLKRPVEAVEHFEAFLATTEGNSVQRQEVEQAVERLTRQLGRLTVHVTPAGARSTLDQQTELRRDAQWVAPGLHRLVITADGFETEARNLAVQAGELSELRIELTPRPKSDAIPKSPAPMIEPVAPPAELTPAQPVALAPVQPSAADPDAHSAALKLWITGGSTLVLGITAAITGQLALAANREFDTNLSAVRNTMLTEFQRAGAWARGVDASDRAEALAAATDVLIALTFVGVGLTTYFYLTGSAAEHSGTQVAFQAGPTSGRVQLRAQF